MKRKKQFIKDLTKEDLVDDVFVVKFKKPVEQYKNGFKFELRIGDSSKEIMYKYWGPADEEKVKLLYDSIKKGDVISAQGKMNEWNNTLEISANERNVIQILQPGEYDLKDFIKISKRDPEVMWSELNELIDSVKDIELKKLLDYFFKNLEFAEKFKNIPAAMYVHHGWIHGLLEHTLDVAKICDNACKIHLTLDRDLAITGALLHDIGKIREFEVKTSINVSTEGMLIGHVTIATEMLTKAMDEIKTPDILKFKILHMELSHMGEYGSNKTPSFPEAIVVYYSDQMNAQLTHMTRLKEEANTEDDYIYHKDFGNIYLN